jgi:hypothetical protein
LCKTFIRTIFLKFITGKTGKLMNIGNRVHFSFIINQGDYPLPVGYEAHAALLIPALKG